MKILLVEDEKFILDFYSSELEYEFPEHTILSALNGEDALAILEDETVDLVLTDGKMPKMDGVQLAQELKKRENAPKVAMITGYVGDYDENDLKEAGIIKVFNKPVDFDELLSFIKNFS